MATFGYTTAGTAGTTSIENAIRGSQFTTPAGGPWSVDQISAYYGPANGHTSKCAIYTAAGVLVSLSQTSVITGVSGAAFRNFVFPGAKPVLAGSTPYILVCWAQSTGGNNVFHFDTGVTGDGKSVAATYAASFPSSLTFGTGPNKYSIYATIHLEVIYGGVIAVSTAVNGSVGYFPDAASTVADTWGSDQWAGAQWGGAMLAPAVVGSVSLQITPAAAILAVRNYVIAGSVTVIAGPAQRTGQWGERAWGDDQWGEQQPTTEFARNSVFPGASTVVIAVAGTLAYNRNALVAGAAAITTTIAAAVLQRQSNRVLAGSVVTAAAVSGVTAANRNAALSGSGAVVCGGTATSAYNRNVVQQGLAAITTTVTAAGLQYTRHGSISGAISTLTVIAAATVTGRSVVLAGSAGVVTGAGATAAYNRNAAIQGVAAITATVASTALQYGLQFILFGGTTIEVGPVYHTGTWGDDSWGGSWSGDTPPMEYNRNPSLAASTLVSVSVAAAELSFRSPLMASITGNATIVSGTAGVAAYNLNASIAGAGSWVWSTGAALEFDSAALGHLISGSVPLIASVSGTSAFNSNYAVGGQTAVITLLAASQLAYNRNALVVAGTVTAVSTTAGLVFGHLGIIVGSVPLITGVSGTEVYNSHRLIAGQTAVITLLAPGMAYGRNVGLVASAPTTVSVLAGLVFAPSPDHLISGSVPLITGVSGTAVYNREPSIDGQTAVITLLSAGLSFTRQAVKAGSVTVSIGVFGVTSTAGYQTPVTMRLHVVPENRTFIHTVSPRRRLAS